MLAWILGNTLVAGAFALALALAARWQHGRPALLHRLWLIALAMLLTPALPLRSTPGEWLRDGLRGLTQAPRAAQGEGAWGTGRPEEAAGEGSPWPAAEDDPVAAPIDGEEVLVWGPAARADLGARVAALGRALWLAGALGMLAMAVRRVAAFQRLVRRARPAPPELRAEVEAVASRLGVAPPRVRLLEGVTSPSIWCLGRPTLLWPGGSHAGAERRARRALIAHELAHLARRDHWVSWVEVPASALLWWNPLFWWIRGRIRHFAELSCDAWAVWTYPADRRAFAEALIDLQARSVRAPVPFAGLGATDSEFKDFEWRLHMIMKRRVTPRTPRGTAGAALLAALLAAPGSSATGANETGNERAAAAVAERVEGARWMQKAERLQDRKDDVLAREAYARALELDPANGRAHARLGVLLIAAGELDEAREHFRRQAGLEHEVPKALYNLACVESLAGNREKALKYVRKALASGFAKLDLLRTDDDLDALRDLPEFADAIERAEAARDLRYELARVESEGDRELFFSLHAELVDLVSADGALLAEHGHLALENGDLDRAAWAFGRQAEVGHDAARAHYNRACARSLLGDLDGALEDLGRAADEGFLYAGMADDGDLAALRGEPGYAALEGRIADRAQALKELKQELHAGRAASVLPRLEAMAADEEERPGGRAWAARRIGDVHLEARRYDQALAWFQTAASHGVSVEQAAFHMARAYAGLGDAQRSLQHVEYALELGYADADAVREALAANAACSAEHGDELVRRAAKAAAAGTYGKGGHGGEQRAWAAGLPKKKGMLGQPGAYGAEPRVARDS